MDIKFPAMRTGFAEAKKANPKVAILDSFRDADSTLAHGEMVESVMLTHGRLENADIQRYHAESGPFISPQEILETPTEQVLEAYDYFTQGATASFFNMVSDNLEQVMAEQPGIKVINQSQSQTPARLAEPFLATVFEDDRFRARLAQRLDLPEDSSGSVVATSLLQHTENLMSNDQDVNQARKRYETTAKEAFDRGIVNVVAAGNQGSLAATLAEQGVGLSPDAFRSILVNDWVTVVGGATKDGRLSPITSPDSGYEVFALAENVPFRVDGKVYSANGTSLSAPLIASLAVQTLEQNPEWGPSEVEAMMKGS
jgi:Subtilase family